MRFTEEIEEQVVAANPCSQEDLKRWAASGGAVSLRERLDEKLTSDLNLAAHKQPRRKVVVLPVVAIFSLLLAGAGWAMTHRAINDPTTVACFGSFSQKADIYAYALGTSDDSPTAICASHWEQDWGSPSPENLMQCVTDYPDGGGGAIGVFPAPKGMTQQDACAAIGAAVPN